MDATRLSGREPGDAEEERSPRASASRPTTAGSPAGPPRARTTSRPPRPRWCRRERASPGRHRRLRDGRGARRRRSRRPVPRSRSADSRRPKNARSISATQSGMIATIRAARPDSSRVSAHATPPFPISSNAAPTMAAARHSRKRGTRPATRSEGVERDPCDQKPYGGHQEWRHRPVGDPDREIRGTPDEVDRGQRKGHRGRGAACESCGHEALD